MERPIAFYPFLARELGSIEAAIYYQQLDYWQDKGSREDGWIYKTRAEIEEETTIKTKTQERIRKMLIAKGWLETKLMKANGSPTIHYKTKVSVQMSLIKRENGSGQSDHMEVVKVSDSLTETTSETTSDIKTLFNKFWKEYPRKVSKTPSSRAFASAFKRNKKRVPEELFKEIMDALALQCKQNQWVKDGGTFVPHASTWLNGERWMDEIDLESEAKVTESKKKAYIEGDQAYKRKDGTWMVITHTGQHCEYTGPLDKVEWK